MAHFKEEAARASESRDPAVLIVKQANWFQHGVRRAAAGCVRSPKAAQQKSPEPIVKCRHGSRRRQGGITMTQSRKDKIRSLRRSAEHCRVLIHDGLPLAVAEELRSFADVLDAEAAKLEHGGHTGEAADEAGEQIFMARRPQSSAASRKPRRKPLQNCA
jgi:hypothetical protein